LIVKIASKNGLNLEAIKKEKTLIGHIVPFLGDYQMRKHRIKWGLVIIMICCVIQTGITLVFFVDWMRTVMDLKAMGHL
jgi:hypothetical protein